MAKVSFFWTNILSQCRSAKCVIWSLGKDVRYYKDTISGHTVHCWSIVALRLIPVLGFLGDCTSDILIQCGNPRDMNFRIPDFQLRDDFL